MIPGKWHLMHPAPGLTAAGWVVHHPSGLGQGYWKTACLLEALETGRILDLGEPILENQTGNWAWEQLKHQGCDHCKHWRTWAVDLQIVSLAEGQWSVQDGQGNMVSGLAPHTLEDFPFDPAQDGWGRLSRGVAEALQSAIWFESVRPYWTPITK